MRATICVGYAHATAALFWIAFQEIPAVADIPGWYPAVIGWGIGLTIAFRYTRGGA